MKKNMIIASITATVSLGIIITAFAMSGYKKDGKVAYPDDYRTWTHVKSMVIQKGHALYDSFGGIHHIYANSKALKAMESGTNFPNGSVLIFDLLEAKGEGNAVIEGSRKVVGVMEKDSKRFADTGGWGFEGFKGDTRERAITDPAGSCFGCHESKEDSGYVFSTYRR